MKLKYVVISIDCADGTNYVELDQNASIVTFHETFTRNCLTEPDVAKRFSTKSGLDPRYKFEDVVIPLRRRKKVPDGKE